MITVRFKFMHETKGALRYIEINDQDEGIELKESVIGTIYLRKSALDGAHPQHIQVSVMMEEA